MMQEHNQAAIAKRALAEAATRRDLAKLELHNAANIEKTVEMQEFGGRAGPDPVRYGDWELNGRAIDF